MARWRWFARRAALEFIAPPERVDATEPPDPGAHVAWPVVPPSWNENTRVFDRVPHTPAAVWRARQAAWRWPE